MGTAPGSCTNGISGISGSAGFLGVAPMGGQCTFRYFISRVPLQKRSRHSRPTSEQIIETLTRTSNQRRKISLNFPLSRLALSQPSKNLATRFDLGLCHLAILITDFLHITQRNPLSAVDFEESVFSVKHTIRRMLSLPVSSSELFPAKSIFSWLICFR